MHKITALLAVLAVPGCTGIPQNAGADSDASDRLSQGRVAKIAEAPDGTILWAVDPPAGRRVYFASSGTQRTVGCGTQRTVGCGTQRTVGCGSNCTRSETVPTAEDRDVTQSPSR